LWHIAVPVSKVPMFTDLFLCILPRLDNIEFFQNHCSMNLADGGKLCANCHSSKQTLIFTLFFCRNTCMMAWFYSKDAELGTRALMLAR
jgi:hypothetical protein